MLMDRAEVFGPARQKHINWANHHAGLSAGESRKLQDKGILWANHHAILSAGEARKRSGTPRKPVTAAGARSHDGYAKGKRKKCRCIRS